MLCLKLFFSQKTSCHSQK